MAFLPAEDFKQIVRNTPLISIDLVIENPDGKILLGWRKNLPAKDHWFVPGGRIAKDEGFEQAFQRIAKTETGSDIAFEDAVFIGVYEHIYPGENFAADTSFGTHYVVMGYWIKLSEELATLPLEQHTDYRWASLDEIEEDPSIHQNTKNYFNGHPAFSG